MITPIILVFLHSNYRLRQAIQLYDIINSLKCEMPKTIQYKIS